MHEPGLSRRTALALLATAPAIAAGPARAASPVTVRIGVQPVESAGQAFYGKDLGWFDQAGLDVQITSLSNGGALVAAVIAGSLDIGLSAVGPIAQAYAKGLGVKIIAPAGMSLSTAPTIVTMVALDSPIKSAADLNGKTIAVNGLKNITQLAPMAWIDAAGGASESVKFIELSFPEMVPALVGGRVDAVLVAEPALSSAGPGVRVLGYPYDAVAPRFLLGCFFATTAYLDRNRATVRKFVDVLREAGSWANAHHAESGEVLAAFTKMDPARITKMTRATFPDRLVPAEVQPVIDLAAKYGVIAQSFPSRQLVWNG